MSRQARLVAPAAASRPHTRASLLERAVAPKIVDAAEDRATPGVRLASRAEGPPRLASDEIVHVALAREVHGHLEHRLEDDNINEQQLSRTQIAVLGEAANLEELAGRLESARGGRTEVPDQPANFPRSARSWGALDAAGKVRIQPDTFLPLELVAWPGRWQRWPRRFLHGCHPRPVAPRRPWDVQGGADPCQAVRGHLVVLGHGQHGPLPDLLVQLGVHGHSQAHGPRVRRLPYPGRQPAD